MANRYAEFWIDNHLDSDEMGQLIEKIFRLFPKATQIGLFGSRGKGCHTLGVSDYDVAVSLAHNRKPPRFTKKLDAFAGKGADIILYSPHSHDSFIRHEVQNHTIPLASRVRFKKDTP